MHKFISKKLQILHYILSVNLFAPPYQGRGPKTTAIFPMLPTTPKLAFGGRESVLGRLALLEVGSEGRPRIFLRFPPLVDRSPDDQSFLLICSFCSFIVFVKSHRFTKYLSHDSFMATARLSEKVPPSKKTLP